MEHIMAIETASTDLGIHTMSQPTTPSAMDFKRQLEVKDVITTRLQKDVQNLLCKTKEKAW
jgi:hypothetical protein